MGSPDLDLHALQSLMKIGGKKKLDALIQMLRENGPARLQELSAASEVAEAHAAARALKSSAINLGLSSLETVCDEILEAKTWAPKSPLAAQAEGAYRRGLTLLASERTKI